MKLSEFLSKFDDVEGAGDGYLARCPAHTDSRPSLRVGISESDKVLLKCRAGCTTEAVLTAAELTMRDLATVTIDDAAPERRATSTDAPASVSAVAALAAELDGYAAALRFEIDNPAVSDTLDYARDRFGLSTDDALRLGLGVQTDGPFDRLVVPFRDTRGIARGYQARAISDNAAIRWKGPRSPEDGGSWTKLAFFPGAAGWHEIVITEGPGDGLTACGLGYDAVGIRGAALVTNEALIAELVGIIGSRKAVIAGDGDTAGWDFSATLAKALMERDVSVAVLDVPDNEDLTSWRASAGADAIIDAINNSRVTVSAASLGRELDEDRYPLNDTGAARWVRDYIRRHDSDIRFTPEAGFYLYDSGVWRRDDLDHVRAWAQDAFEDMLGRALDFAAASAESDDEEQQKRAAARLSHSKKYLNAVPMDNAFRQLRALRDVATSFSEFDKNPHVLAARNGVVDLRTGRLLPHSPALMLTQQVAVDFHPDAKAPRWQQFLEEVFPCHPELPSYMQRMIGYGVTGNTDEQCFVIHWGRGSNGKSVFLDTLTELFRDATVTTSFATFEKRASGGIPNDLAALKGARLVMASEGESDVPMAEAVLKRVTGRDLISARFMRQEFFEFRPAFLLHLATNAKPRFRGQDEGLWRRVKLIPWARYFAPDERDPKLGADLLAESEGILAWAVAGAREWYAHGLEDPPMISAATKVYRENSNTLDGFLPGMFELGNETDTVDGPKAYEAYLEWAEEEHLSPRETWTRRTFYAALEERGPRKVRKSSGMAFVGIRHADGNSPEQERAASPAPSGVPVTKQPQRAIQGADLDALTEGDTPK